MYSTVLRCLHQREISCLPRNKRLRTFFFLYWSQNICENPLTCAGKSSRSFVQHRSSAQLTRWRRTDGQTEPPPFFFFFFLLHMISFLGRVRGKQNCHSSSANIRHPSEKVTYSVRVRTDFARRWALPAMAPLPRLTGRFLRTVSHTELGLQNNSGWEAERTPANWLAERGRAANSQPRPRIWHFQNSSLPGRVFLPRRCLTCQPPLAFPLCRLKLLHRLASLDSWCYPFPPRTPTKCEKKKKRQKKTPHNKLSFCSMNFRISPLFT